jgi:hypothetical protein
MALDYVTAGLDARHRAALEEMCARRQASKTAVLRQAIRLLDFCDRKAMQGKSLAWTDDDGAPRRVFDEIQRTEAEFAASLDPRGRPVRTGPEVLVLAGTYQQAVVWARENFLTQMQYVYVATREMVMGMDFARYRIVRVGTWMDNREAVAAWDYIVTHHTFLAQLHKQMTEEKSDEFPEHKRRADAEQHVPAAVQEADRPREDAGRGGEGEGGGAAAGDPGAAPGP